MSVYAIKTSEPFGISQSICTRTLRNLTRYLHRNPPEPHQASSPPKPSGTSQGICTGTLRNLMRYLPRNPPEPHHASSPRPSGTSSGSCTGNFRNLTRYLHRNPPEPHRTLRSLSRDLHRNPPEPHEVSAPEPSGTSRGICTRTLRNLVRNLVLKLHRIAPELIWAKDPIAKFCCWGKTMDHQPQPQPLVGLPVTWPCLFHWRCRNHSWPPTAR